MDINTAVGRKRGIPEDKLQAVDRYADHPGFTPRERAALAWAEMVTISPNDITDEQFAELRQHFSEREVVELTVQAAFENFRARVNRSLRIEDDGFAKMPVEQLPKAF
jgi:alkylhydroperoxidase family enzyme